jgi:hypothetical protein
VIDDTDCQLQLQVLLFAIDQECLSLFLLSNVHSVIQQHQWYSTISYHAIQNNKLVFLEWLLTTSYKEALLGDKDLVMKAIEYGCKTLLKWLLDHEVSWNPLATWFAILCDQFDMVRFLIIECRKEGWKWHPDTLREAPHHCSDEEVMWLLDHGCPWNYEVLGSVALKGRFDLLQQLITWKGKCLDREDKIDDITYMLVGCVCLYHDLEAIKATLLWVVQHGVSWSPITSMVIVRNRDLAFLRWAVDHGCPIHPLTLNEAIKYDRLDIVQYLHQDLHQSWDSQTPKITSKSSYEMVKYVFNHGCNIKEGCLKELVTNRGPGERLREIMKWALTEGCKWDPFVFEYVLYQGDVEAMQWLITNNYYIDKERIERLIANGYLTT